MSGLKEVDRLQIYTGPADRASGDLSNFSLQAAAQLYHSISAMYKVYQQQVVMRNDFNVFPSGKSYLIVGQNNTRRVTVGNETGPGQAIPNAMFQVRASGTIPYAPITLDTGN